MLGYTTLMTNKLSHDCHLKFTCQSMPFIIHNHSTNLNPPHHPLYSSHMPFISHLLLSFFKNGYNQHKNFPFFSLEKLLK